jgi:uncharacterized protein (UPF0297 family)
LYETTNKEIVVPEIKLPTKLLGFDCIGNVYYSYLKNEYNYIKNILNYHISNGINLRKKRKNLRKQRNDNILEECPKLREALYKE